MLSTRAISWLLMLAALLAVGCEESSPAPSDDDGERRSKTRRRRVDTEADEARDDRKVLKELKAWIRAAQHDVYVDGDAAGYWKIYADDANVINARGPSPHPYDYVVPASRAQEFVKVRDELGKVGALKEYEQRYENETETLADDKATFTWHVHTSWKEPDGVVRAVYGERYTLHRRPDAKKVERWRVSEKRSWTLSTTRPPRENEVAAYPKGVVVKYDGQLWGELDAQVDRARLVGGRDLFWALTNAGRYPEAYQLAKSFTSLPRPLGEAYYLLGYAAARLNHGQETKDAYAKARALDPRIYPPHPWGPRPPTNEKKKGEPLLDFIRPASAATL